MATTRRRDASTTRLPECRPWSVRYTRGFLASVEKKLNNERFVANAPAAVVEGERKKKADAESKIATMEQALQALKK